MSPSSAICNRRAARCRDCGYERNSLVDLSASKVGIGLPSGTAVCRRCCKMQHGKKSVRFFDAEMNQPSPKTGLIVLVGRAGLEPATNGLKEVNDLRKAL